MFVRCTQFLVLMLGLCAAGAAQTTVEGWVHDADGKSIPRPTSDAVTPLSIGSRSALTAGVKSDVTLLRRGHVIKAGVDLVQLRELESFFIDGRGFPTTGTGSPRRVRRFQSSTLLRAPAGAA